MSQHEEEVVEEMHKSKSEKAMGATRQQPQEQPGQFKAKKKKIIPPPSLADLIRYLEDANTHPSDALEHLLHLADSCEEILGKISQLDVHFVPNKSDDEICEMIEEFMQNALLLIDNYFDDM